MSNRPICLCSCVGMRVHAHSYVHVRVHQFIRMHVPIFVHMQRLVHACAGLRAHAGT